MAIVAELGRDGLELGTVWLIIAPYVTGSPGRRRWTSGAITRPTPASTWPSRHRSTGSGIHARHVPASATPGPTRSSPAKNDSTSAQRLSRSFTRNRL